MLCMAETLLKFLNWLTPLMEEKGIAPADIARTGFVTDSAVSLLLSMKTKSVSVEMCKAISKAADVPLVTVYRAAGILPPENGSDPWVEEMDHKLRQLSPTLRDVANRFINSLAESEEAEKRKAKPKTKSAGT